MHVVRYSWKLQLNACLSMPIILRNDKAQISCWVKLFCWFVACSLHPWSYSLIMELIGYGPACPKFTKLTNDYCFWKGLSDFVGLLGVIIYFLLDIHWNYKNMPFWVGIITQGLSTNQIVRCLKLKKLEKYILRYQVDFLHVVRWPLKLQKYDVILDCVPKCSCPITL